MELPFRAVIVVGPTASGKTALAHGLADRLCQLGRRVELVNLDAFQIYRGVTAGTAKPSAAEMQRYSYHCIDFAEADARIDAQMFARMAHDACAAIFERGAIPLAVGGSGLYLRAFLHGLDPLPEKDDSIRQFLRASAARFGWSHLHRWLQLVDRVRAAELHPNDGVRIERALEITLLTGEPASEQRTRTDATGQQKSLFDALVIQTEADDATLRQRITRRVPELIKLGWESEVRGMRSRFGERLAELQCMKAIGYKEILEAIEAIEADLRPEVYAGVAERIATLTWQYARRQRVWNAKERCDLLFSHGRDSLETTSDALLRWWDGT
jgi:tRNA dimethylallyltransferase